MDNLEKLAEKIGYRFKQTHFIDDALSHRSLQGKNYERLEFLGDAILNFIIASALFQRNPSAREGELSRIRANLVRGETLTALAQGFGLGQYLRLGIGELKSGGAERTSILADAMEAVIGAIYLDSDMQTCETVVLKWYETRLADLANLSTLKDAKTLLQEYLQARKLALPTYKIIEIAGAAHQQTFRVQCSIQGLPQTSVGEASSRRKAEQVAAENILRLLQNDA